MRVDSFMLRQRLGSREGVSSCLFGVIGDVHGTALKKHISCLVKICIAGALDGAPMSPRYGKYAVATSLT